jgi:hypothetical protein
MFQLYHCFKFSPSTFKRDGKEKAKYVNKDEKIKSYMLSQILRQIVETRKVSVAH